MQTLVEEAHRELQELYSFSVMERRESRKTTAGNPSLGLIDAAASATVGGSPGERFKEYKSDEPPYWTDDSGTTRFLEISFNEAEVRRAYNQDTTAGIGEPRVLLHRHQASDDYPGGTEWKVYPVPNGAANTSDGEYSILIPFYRYLATPTTSDWFTDNAEPFILAAATSKAFELDWDEAKALYWRQRAYGPAWDARGIMGGELKRIVNLDKQHNVSHVHTLIPYAGPAAVKIGGRQAPW